MPFNGSGVFNRLYSWIADAANSIPITASRMDPDSNDIAQGLTNCVTRDGQSPAMANLPMGGFKFTNCAVAALTNEFVTLGQANSLYALGYTPVQQGTGVGQLGNTVKLGWSAANKLKLTIDASDQGNVALEPWATAAFFPFTGGTITGGLTVNGATALTGPIATLSASSTNAVYWSISNTKSGSHAYAVGSSGGGPASDGSFFIYDLTFARTCMTIDPTGNGVFQISISSPSVTQTSDARLKDIIGDWAPRDLTSIRIAEYTWKESGKYGVSPIAQEVQSMAHEYVHEGADGILSVDKAGLALERVAFLEGVLKKAGLL